MAICALPVQDGGGAALADGAERHDAVRNGVGDVVVTRDDRSFATEVMANTLPNLAAGEIVYHAPIPLLPSQHSIPAACDPLTQPRGSAGLIQIISRDR